MLKDVGLIERFGDSLQSPVPALRLVGRNLASALIKALEAKADVAVKAA
jgi:hypothetical protein